MKGTGEPVTCRGAADNEEGTALIPVLALLFALSLLAALWMAGAHADALVAARRKSERESSYAVEAVLALSLAALETQGDRLVPREAIFAPSPSFATAPQRGNLRGWEYAWRAVFLPDATDADGDPRTATVLYDRAFGYGRSPFPSAGFPVLKIDVTVARGEARRSLVAAAAPLCLDTSVPAAWTAGGGLTLDGPFLVSGGGHDGDGEPAASSLRAPAAIVAGGELSLLGGAAVDGGAVLLPGGTLPDDISAFLCPACSPGTVDALPPPDIGAGSLRGMLFSRESYRGPLRGEGVLIVHNPRFLPALYEASRLALEEGLLTEAYDPSYSHLDPDNQPALLEVASEGFFRGLVVADAVGDIHEKVRVVGAVRTLGRTPLKVRAWEAAEVLHSAETLRRAGLGPFCLLLETKVLPADESRLR